MKKLSFLSVEIFHIFNKSIANYGIFKDLTNSQRFINVLDYYNSSLISESFSKYLKRNDDNYNYSNVLYPKEFAYIKFLSYCIMPDHYHLLLKILKNKYLSKYISDVENSFTRYFNIRFKRKGPLWQTSFKAVRIKNDQQLLHVSRYIHLNPITANLVNRSEDWKFSSYQDFINDKKS